MRTKLYTKKGLKRVRCSHCGRLPCGEQWTLDACANGDKGEQHGLCIGCDIDLNAFLLDFFRIKDAKKKIESYSVRMMTQNHE